MNRTATASTDSTLYSEIEGDSMTPFYAAFKSDATKESYTRQLRQLFKHTNLAPDEFAKMAKEQPRKVETIPMDFEQCLSLE